MNFLRGVDLVGGVLGRVYSEVVIVSLFEGRWEK